MTFWSSQTLATRLPSLIDPYDASNIEQASYTLRVGNEVFVTKDHSNSDNQHVRKLLDPGQDFTIPPGQFAFLLTEESVKIPEDAIAFISMKAGIKHRGLVNISGFHVDPGFEGKLLFSVYNAGPSQIRLNHNQQCFLIWYASLDQVDTSPRTKPGYTSFPVDVLDKISTDKIYSLQALTTGFRDIEFNVSNKVTEIDAIKKSADGVVFFLKWVGGILAAILIATIVSLCIGVPKFAIEQRELVSNLAEYKVILDELVERKKLINGTDKELAVTKDKEQKEFISHLIEHKEILNQLVKQKEVANKKSNKIKNQPVK
jgi:dCTP deaminase